MCTTVISCLARSLGEPARFVGHGAWEVGVVRDALIALDLVIFSMWHFLG